MTCPFVIWYTMHEERIELQLQNIFHYSHGVDKTVQRLYYFDLAAAKQSTPLSHIREHSLTTFDFSDSLSKRVKLVGNSIKIENTMLRKNSPRYRHYKREVKQNMLIPTISNSYWRNLIQRIRRCNVIPVIVHTVPKTREEEGLLLTPPHLLPKYGRIWRIWRLHALLLRPMCSCVFCINYI